MNIRRTRITAADGTEEEPLLSILPTDEELQNLRRRLDVCDEILSEQARQLRELMR